MTGIAVTGSVATDHLMRFPGRFAEQLLPDKLDTISLSFLVDRLEVRRGGVGANIAFGLGLLGLRPVLVAAVGTDFAEYRAQLERHGVDCGQIRASDTTVTARFVCTTDTDLCQMAAFFPGAMVEAAEIDLVPLLRGADRPDLVIVAADDPVAMARHARSCRRAGVPFAADPSQQLARMSGAQILEFIQGARYLLTNEYEAELLLAKTGLDEAALAALVPTWVTTLGARGVRVVDGGEAVHVPAAAPRAVVEPTGSGDAFRAGFFAALIWGLDLTHAARVGCQLATLALETVGTQEYTVCADEFVDRFAVAYGPTAAARLHAAWSPCTV